jgi:EmrB/QacA subfamily drug resistance transporter
VIDTIPKSESRATWTLVLASVGLGMTALDNLVVTTALPVLRTSLHASLSSLEWTVNAFVLSFACSLLTGAALGDRFGRRRVFCIGVAVFTAASTCAALAPTVAVLIAARAVQGMGAAMVMPLTLTLISEAFPPDKRGMAIGLWGGIAGLAVAAGPVVGGAVVQGINWHWIFWLNVPIGLAVVPLGATHLAESFGPRPRLDVVGLLLAGTGFFGITWGLVRSNALGWSSAEVLVTLVGGAVLVTLFVLWERRALTPMVTLSLFREPRFSAANGVAFFMYAGLFGALFLMAQFFQIAQHHTPLETGVRLLPWTAAPLLSPVFGKLADRYGNRPFMAVGLLLQAVALGWIATVAQADLGYPQLGAALGLAGFGVAMFFPTVANEVVGIVPPAEVGVASGTNSALRELGGVFGVAVLAAVFARPGIYASAAIFTDGFKSALWVGAAFSAVASVLAASTFVRARAPRLGRTERAKPALADISE